MSKGPIRHIVLLSPAKHRALDLWFAAAYLGARFSTGGCRITVIDEEADKAESVAAGQLKIDSEIIGRPALRRFHQLLQITDEELTRVAGAQPVLCAEASYRSRIGEEGRLLLPFGPYGRDRAGAGFHHYWVRSGQVKPGAPLEAYNLSIMAHRAGLFSFDQPSALPPYDFGYRLSVQGYTRLLRDYARRLGVTTSAYDVDGDLYITVSGKAPTPEISDVNHDAWVGDKLDLGMQYGRDEDIGGSRLYRLQSALQRLMDLWPDRSFSEPELAEYNRLTTAETSRLEDMAALLSGDKNRIEASPSLMRKIDIFSARGRVPKEDFEVYTEAEWLAALFACGYKPARYDRLVDALDEGALSDWLQQIETAVANAKASMTKVKRSA